MEPEEKLARLVEMKGYSVLRCKPCGQFLPEPARNAMNGDPADANAARNETRNKAREQGVGQSA
jgi:hypothetical protein